MNHSWVCLYFIASGLLGKIDIVQGRNPCSTIHHANSVPSRTRDLYYWLSSERNQRVTTPMGIIGTQSLGRFSCRTWQFHFLCSLGNSANVFAISILWLCDGLACLRPFRHRRFLHSSFRRPDQIPRGFACRACRVRRSNRPRADLRTNSRHPIFLDTDRLQLRDFWRNSASLLFATDAQARRPLSRF